MTHMNRPDEIENPILILTEEDFTDPQETPMKISNYPNHNWQTVKLTEWN